MDISSLTFFATILCTLGRDRRNSRKEIESTRDRRLRSLVLHAREHVPFQRSRLTNVDHKNIRFSDIPPTDKHEMMAAFNETIADRAVTLDEVLATDVGPHRLELPVIRGKYIAVKTSGTSGKPSWTVTGMRDWARLRGAALARMARSWLTYRRMAISSLRPLRTATLAAANSHLLTWQVSRSAELMAGPFARVRFFSVIDPVERIVEGLNAYRPEYLHAYPTAMEMIARYRLDGGTVAFDPKLISTSSEVCTPMAREAIRNAFPSTQLVDAYGTSECLPLSTECHYGRKHINTDFAILEPMDENGHPVTAGELSDHVLITNLLNRVQPFIRYRIDDSVRLTGEACPCGSVFPVIEMAGRKGSLIHLRSDRGAWRTLSPLVVLDTMLYSRGVAQYQVVHVRQNELFVKFVLEKGADSREVADSIRQQFTRVLNSLESTRSVSVAVEQVDGFQRTAGGKLVQTISLVTPPALAPRAAA